MAVRRGSSTRQWHRQWQVAVRRGSSKRQWHRQWQVAVAVATSTAKWKGENANGSDRWPDPGVGDGTVAYYWQVEEDCTRTEEWMEMGPKENGENQVGVLVCARQVVERIGVGQRLQ
eukprot:SAG31_NODE_28914_length_403_cov_1.358553_1_plen_116_part_10